ncbi:MAG: ATP-dependent Clp protease ATP-binding subunit ClpA [Pseudomonadota bacterium]
MYWVTLGRKLLEISLQKAVNLARDLSHDFATTEHLLLALTEDSDALPVMIGCAIDINQLKDNINHYLSFELSSSKKQRPIARPSPGFQKVIHKAAINAHAAGCREVTGANVLAEIFSEQDSTAVMFLSQQHITRLDILNFIYHGVAKYDSEHIKDSLDNETDTENTFNLSTQLGATRDNEHSSFRKNDLINQKSNKSSQTALENYCINLVDEAINGKIDRLIGRDSEIDRAIEILCRRNKNNPIFVGEPGVGKTAIAEGLALRIAEKKVPKALRKAVVYSLDMASMLAGTRYRGDFEERVKSVSKEIEKIPDAILFIDEIHIIVGAGATSGGSLDASNLLKPILTRGKFRCIGATTFKEYNATIDKDAALARRFQMVVVKEPTVEQTIQIMIGLKDYYEKHHGVKYSLKAIEGAAKLSERYIHQKHLPDKAIDVLDEAGAKMKLGNGKNKMVNLSHIEEIVSKIAGVPVKSLSLSESEKLKHLKGDLQQVIFGQNSAVEALCTAIKLSRAGLREHQKPIGSYLFAGPTGVGKTELAKQLSKLMNMELVRFDMSEFMEKHTVSRLIGTPPGYVGYDQGGMLTDAINKTPYSVLLLDEIEKADSDIYNIMLQVMDYGKLTDHHGRVINFSNCIIIMTTNIGADQMGKGNLGFTNSGNDNTSLAVKNYFTPEFLNRLDAIIQFAPLDDEVVTKVVDKYIALLQNQLGERKVKIEVTEKAKKYLAKIGHDPEYGARPLERVIDSKIRKALADEILFGKLTKGGVVEVHLDKDDEIYFTMRSPEGKRLARNNVAANVKSNPATV